MGPRGIRPSEAPVIPCGNPGFERVLWAQEESNPRPPGWSRVDYHYPMDPMIKQNRNPNF